MKLCDVCADGTPGSRQSTKCEIHYREVMDLLKGIKTAPAAAAKNAKDKSDARKLAIAVIESGRLPLDRVDVLRPTEVARAVEYATRKKWLTLDGDTLLPGSVLPALPLSVRAILLGRYVHAHGPCATSDAVAATGIKPRASNGPQVVRMALDAGWIVRPVPGRLEAGPVVPPGSQPSK